MATRRNVYLDMKTVEEAAAVMSAQFGSLSVPAEKMDVTAAKGRVLAEPAVSALSSPNFHAAAMDGIAVNAEVTFGANEEAPILLKPDQNAFWVNTGRPMPEGTNAVIMIEHLNILESGVEIESPVFPWQNVRKMGEDIVATELLFPRGHQISAYAIGAMLSGGIFDVQVYQKPHVLIIPTGSELVPWQEVKPSEMKPGDVVESNSQVLAALCEDHGAKFTVHPMLKDDLDTIRATVKTAVEKYDMVCIIGGSSAGSMDFAKPVIESLGELHVHGVTMMPGKPMMFGTVSGTPVFGIPGYPVSAIVAFEQFAGPLLLNMQHLPPIQKTQMPVAPARKITSRLGQEEFLRVKVGSVDGRLIASQLPRGAGNITTLTEADAVIRIPKNSEGIEENKPADATLLRPLSAIENTIVIIGSHDNTLDVLADQIRKKDGSISISSSHVGSMGGLSAIRKKNCHLAGAHLLDPEDGSYNISYLKKYLPDENLVLVNLVLRDQGLIVAPGNPKNIRSLEDMAGGAYRFINRQPGSGTRILLDYKLDVLKIPGTEISGYEDEEYTHMSVAAAVLSGRSDAGLGIHAAARALGLDFIPVVTESYDLVIPARFFDTPKIQVLLETIQTNGFKDRVNAMGGYDTSETGKIRYRV